jgi:predicted secreted protein
MRPLIFALALLGAACTPENESEDVTPPASQEVSAPTPDDVTVRINAAQAGQTVEVAVNQRFAVELVGVPTAGYVWAPAQLPPFLTRAGEATGNTVPEQSQPGYAGGNHWEVLMFAATQAGTGDLVIEQRRPWESDEPPTDTFRVTIVAR